MATCRSCGAEILWAKTTAGKNIPLDVESRPDGNVVLSRGVGGFLARVLGSGPEADSLAGEPHYVSHFATCKDADQHRRPR